MPVYEYEPDDRECLMCDGRIAVIQALGEEPLQYCPHCGLEIRKVISRASFNISRDASPDKAGSKGFTTYRRVEQGKWEKVSGEGADMLVGSQDDIEAVQAEKTPPKVINLDKD